MITDPIADLLTRIRNAQGARLAFTSAPYSKLKAEILRLLKENKFILDYKVEGNDQMKTLEIELDLKRPALTLERVSKPGQRIYIASDELKKVRSGLGINLVSTNKGLMTGAQAKKQNLGGEVICQVY